MKNLSTNLESTKCKYSRKYQFDIFGTVKKSSFLASSLLIFISQFLKITNLEYSAQNYLSNGVYNIFWYCIYVVAEKSCNKCPHTFETNFRLDENRTAFAFNVWGSWWILLFIAWKLQWSSQWEWELSILLQ